MNYLMADSITGIWEVETLEGEDCEVMTQQEFAEELDTLAEDRVIACQADAEYCARFERDYFVQFLQ